MNPWNNTSAMSKPSLSNKQNTVEQAVKTTQILLQQFYEGIFRWNVSHDLLWSTFYSALSNRFFLRTSSLWFTLVCRCPVGCPGIYIAAAIFSDATADVSTSRFKWLQYLAVFIFTYFRGKLRLNVWFGVEKKIGRAFIKMQKHCFHFKISSSQTNPPLSSSASWRCHDREEQHSDRQEWSQMVLPAF